MLRRARRLVIAVIGGTILLIGIAMLVLPGPALFLIPVGLAILATEFLWARRLLKRTQESFRRSPRTHAPDASRSDGPRGNSSPRR